MKLAFIITQILTFLSIPLFSQEVEMADTMRGEGKIYIVVIVIAIITIGLFGYLLHLDRKLTGKEKTESNK